MAQSVTWQPTVNACDDYLNSRTGRYEWRCVRYDAALRMCASGSLHDTDTLVDVGAGWTELAHRLHVAWNWRGRYIPVDGGIDGTDLNEWVPPREAEWFVALEIIEHLHRPGRLLEHLKANARKGVIVSAPNPRTTDVLGMDPTHVTPIHADWLRELGFTVQERSFYGAPDDSLFAWWLPT